MCIGDSTASSPEGKWVLVTGNKGSSRYKRCAGNNIRVSSCDDSHGDELPVHKNRWHMLIFQLHSESFPPFDRRDGLKGMTTRRAGSNAVFELKPGQLNMRGSMKGSSSALL